MLNDFQFKSIRKELSHHKYTIKKNNQIAGLGIKSCGDINAVSCWHKPVKMQLDQWYKVTVKIKTIDIENSEISVLAQICSHYLKTVSRTNDYLLLETNFLFDRQYSNSFCDNSFTLFLRSCQAGSVEFYEPEIEMIDKPKQRTCRIATIKMALLDKPVSISRQQQRIKERIDEAAKVKPDLILLTEFSNVQNVDVKGKYTSFAEIIPHGRTCEVFSNAAKKYKCYVVGGIIEKRGKYFYNTAVIFDRKGKYLGHYSKTHLTFYEMVLGFSSGSDYPVFELDFGKIGIHICYDQWFPEVARFFAQAGAEILLLPVMGGKPITWRTRAMDNNMYFVASSHNPPSMIIDSSGVILSQVDTEGFAFADLNLDWRCVNVYKDPTLIYGMPCISKQMQNTADDKLIKNLYSNMQDSK